MTQPCLSISRIERKLTTGAFETLDFETGVNVLVGRPNTGKTKWLQTLDFLLGDVGENPFDGEKESGLSDKFDAAAAVLMIDQEPVRIERRWREPGAKTKVFVNDESMTGREFQHWLMKRLGIPILSFPKGDPMSGQTWPELSFRMLLRHVYRQQRFWSGIADLQPEGEQHACILQFLGIAERIYTESYGQLVELKAEVERLKARRQQYTQTLEELASDVLTEPGLTVGLSSATIATALRRLAEEVEALRKSRIDLLVSARERAIAPSNRGYVVELGEKRVEILARLEEFRRKSKGTSERITEMRRYRTDLADEVDRICRAEDAGVVLADLKITHCPACDQTIAASNTSESDCFLCHQKLPVEPVIEELGSVRLRYERDRLSGELKEADELLNVLEKECAKLREEASAAEGILRAIESELVPSRNAVGALVQEDVSAIDVTLGKLSERRRQIERIATALEVGVDLTKRIGETENKIEPLQAQVDEMSRSTDYDAAAAMLEDGMNEYLNALNELRPGVWRHSPVRCELSRSRFNLRVGARHWSTALGGTDTLYFLMSYHYGLLTLSNKENCHYPGISIIDVPAEFSGEAIEDKENFIVQPFINLLSQEEFAAAQVIMTGASFAGLKGAHLQRLTHVHVA